MPRTLSMRLKVRPEVYSTYWYFASERQNIFFKKLSGGERPYTNDPILATYKFCNVYRAADRVSQYLINHVIYGAKADTQDTLFRIFLFRLLNKSETWAELEKRLGGIGLATFAPKRYAQVLEDIKGSGQPIYGNAFILCANKAFGFDAKHRNHLALLEEVFVKSRTGHELLGARSLADLYLKLLKLPLIGEFMAYQLAIDFNYSEVFDFDENDFTVAGPGARRGIAKCFRSTNGYSHADIIKYMVDNQDGEFARLGLEFRQLGQRPLHAIDCQGLFCEVDKYSRVKFPALASNRARIKARYQPSSRPIHYFFPPKWGINLQAP